MSERGDGTTSLGTSEGDMVPDGTGGNAGGDGLSGKPHRVVVDRRRFSRFGSARVRAVSAVPDGVGEGKATSAGDGIDQSVADVDEEAASNHSERRERFRRLAGRKPASKPGVVSAWRSANGKPEKRDYSPSAAHTFIPGPNRHKEPGADQKAALTDAQRQQEAGIRLHFLLPPEILQLPLGHTVYVDGKTFQLRKTSTRVGHELSPPYLGLVGPVHPIAPLRVDVDAETGEEVVWISHLRCAIAAGSLDT